MARKKQVKAKEAEQSEQAAENEQNDWKKNQEALRAALNKKHNSGRNKKIDLIFKMSDKNFARLAPRYVSSGDLGLDILLGGGWRRGVMHKIQGQFSTAKSKSVLTVAEIFINHLKEPVLIIDYEGRWTPDWVVQHGISPDSELLHYTRPESAEQAFDILEGAVMANAYSMIVLDSIAAMSPSEEIEKAHDEATQAALARLVGKFCRKYESRMNHLFLHGKELPTVFLLNQVRSNIHARFDKDVTPGGTQQDNTANTILQLRRAEKLEVGEGEDTTVYGFMVSATTKKINGAPPFRAQKYGIITEDGGYEGHHQYSYYHADTLHRFGQRIQLITQSGAWYEVAGFGKYQGASKLRNAIMESPEMREIIVNAVKDALPQLPIQFDAKYIRSTYDN